MNASAHGYMLFWMMKNSYELIKMYKSLANLLKFTFLRYILFTVIKLEIIQLLA